jgi:hypothetical protein
MKEINDLKELQKIEASGKSSIIEFGMPKSCVACLYVDEHLKTMEQKLVFEDLDYYFCKNIDIMTKLGYNYVPVVLLVSKKYKAEQFERDISTNYEKLVEWINSVIKN